MNFGFNSNVRVGSATYHVQTEDRGPSHPYFDTVVYLAGRVIYKRSISYKQFASGTKAEALPQKLHEWLAQQHREVISELEAGILSLKLGGKSHSTAAGVDSRGGFDLRLTNPKNCFAAGNVTLEIELCERNSKQRVGDADVQAVLELGKKRIPCAEGCTDAKGCATLMFPIPSKPSDGASLVVRATDGSRYGELRFRLKAKPRDKAPAPIAR